MVQLLQWYLVVSPLTIIIGIMVILPQTEMVFVPEVTQLWLPIQRMFAQWSNIYCKRQSWRSMCHIESYRESHECHRRKL